MFQMGVFLVKVKNTFLQVVDPQELTSCDKTTSETCPVWWKPSEALASDRLPEGAVGGISMATHEPQITAEASSATEAGGSKSKPRTKLSRSARAKRAKKAQKEVRRKLWCHVHIDPVCLQLDNSFNKKVIGRGGENTRRINDLTGAKVRLRGRGSGHWEDAVRKGGKGWREAPVPLMIAVTSDDCDPGAFCLAVNVHDVTAALSHGACRGPCFGLAT